MEWCAAVGSREGNRTMPSRSLLVVNAKIHPLIALALFDDERQDATK